MLPQTEEQALGKCVSLKPLLVLNYEISSEDKPVGWHKDPQIQGVQMKRLSLILMVAALFLSVATASAQYILPNVGYGIDIGIVRGDNAGSNETAAFMFRGAIQVKLAEPLLTQVSLGYTHMTADGPFHYDIQPLVADARLMIAPIRMDQMFPFLYVGIGVLKDMSTSGGSIMPFVPFGLGIQSKIGPQLMMKANFGYNLVLSDELDQRDRTSGNLNRFTNGKQDGYGEIMVGIVYTGPSYPIEDDSLSDN